jgi:transcriptional regulator with XRE-family HTH domain
MTMTIGQRVRLFREKLGMTQPEASERSGISQASWSRIETDQKTPTAGEVLGLSWALGLPFDTVVGQGALRERMRFAARTASPIQAAEAQQTSAIKEEMLFLAEFAAELRDSGYLTARA